MGNFQGHGISGPNFLNCEDRKKFSGSATPPVTAIRHADYARIGLPLGIRASHTDAPQIFGAIVLWWLDNWKNDIISQLPRTIMPLTAPSLGWRTTGVMVRISHLPTRPHHKVPCNPLHRVAARRLFFINKFPILLRNACLSMYSVLRSPYSILPTPYPDTPPPHRDSMPTSWASNTHARCLSLPNYTMSWRRRGGGVETGKQITVEPPGGD